MNLKHCIGQKFNVNVIKATHRMSNFLKTLVSQEIFASIGLRKKSVLKLPKFWMWKMLFIYIFAYNFVNVGMKPVCKG